MTALYRGDSHEVRLAVLQEKLSDETLRRLKTELVELLVREHEDTVARAQETGDKAAMVHLAGESEDGVMETQGRMEEEEQEEEEDTRSQAHIIYIPPQQLADQRFDPRAVARPVTAGDVAEAWDRRIHNTQ